MNVDGIGNEITDFLTGGLSAEEMIKQRTAKKAAGAETRAGMFFIFII